MIVLNCAIPNKFRGSAHRCRANAKLADSADARSDLEHQIEEGFDAELLELAMHRVKKRVKPVTWQAFHLTAVAGLTGADAAQKLQIPVAHVFLAKNRVQKMLRDEARILRSGKR